MRDFKSGGRFGGGNRGRGNGGGGFRDKGRHRDDPSNDSFRPKQMFQATCARCSKSCEVPFRPNGKKPVFCSECFKNGTAEESFRSSRPSFQSDRPQYERSEGERRGGDQSAHLQMLNTKLDTLIKMVKELTAFPAFEGEDDEVDADIDEPIKKVSKKTKKTTKK